MSNNESESRDESKYNLEIPADEPVDEQPKRKKRKHVCEGCKSRVKCDECGVHVDKTAKKSTENSKKGKSEWHQFVSAQCKGKKFKNKEESLAHFKSLRGAFDKINPKA